MGSSFGSQYYTKNPVEIGSIIEFSYYGIDIL